MEEYSALLEGEEGTEGSAPALWGPCWALGALSVPHLPWGGGCCILDWKEKLGQVWCLGKIRKEQKSGSTSFSNLLVGCMDVLSVWDWEENLHLGFGVWDGHPGAGISAEDPLGVGSF